MTKKDLFKGGLLQIRTNWWFRSEFTEVLLNTKLTREEISTFTVQFFQEVCIVSLLSKLQLTFRSLLNHLNPSLLSITFLIIRKICQYFWNTTFLKAQSHSLPSFLKAVVSNILRPILSPDTKVWRSSFSVRYLHHSVLLYGLRSKTTSGNE